MTLTTTTMMRPNSDSLIDRYIVLTMPRSIRRQLLIFGNLCTQQVPYEKIEFIAGIDARDYNFNMKEIADAADADGYGFLQQFALGIKEQYTKQSAGNIALFWNWAKTLKYIATSGLTAVILWDDRFLTVPHPILEKLAHDLYTQAPEFYIAQLRLRINIEFPKLLDYEIPEFENTPKYHAIFQETVYTISNYRDMYFETGMLGYDESMLLSPKGAQWLLDEILNMKDLSDHLLDFEFPVIQSREDITEKNIHSKERSRLNNDNWLCWGLTDAVKTALTENKGFYFPKHPQYAFVNEPIISGSDVIWSSKDNRNYDSNIQKLPIRKI